MVAVDESTRKPEKEADIPMTENTKIISAQAAHDGYVAAHKKQGDPEPGNNKPVSRDEKGEPNNMDEDVTTSSSLELLTCPQCGKSTLRVEFPDQYEAWTKCSSCGFFMGMSKADWHKMQNSPNVIAKIKKMAQKKDLLKA
jgi:predicted RNA-binding Zn-ribbon protein involved in translation (DUF1610 family)